MAKGFSLKLGDRVFKTTYRVIYGDTDAAGVVYNANYLRYFEIGRTEMMRAWAIPYSRVEELGYVLPVTESYLRFKASARYDDLLTISTSLVEVKKVSCRFNYLITRDDAAAGREQVLVRGFTTLACLDTSGKLSAFPDELAQLIRPLIPAESGLD